MEIRTNLRSLRQKHRISLAELAAFSELSRQYINRIELGQTAATSLLETNMASAMEGVIAKRKRDISLLETDYLRRRGRLLGEEERLNE